MTAPAKQKHAGGRPPKFSAAAEMQAKIDEYFAQCDTKDKPYTISGLAYHLDMTTQALRDYGRKGDEFLCVKKAKQRIESCFEENLTKGNATGSIFWLKNHAGYKDAIEQKHTGDPDNPVIVQHIRPSITREEWLKHHGLDTASGTTVSGT